EKPDVVKSDNLELDAIRDQQTACDSIGRAIILSSVLASIATFSLGLDSLSSILLADPPSGQQSPSPNRGEDLSLQLLPTRVGNMIRADHLSSVLVRVLLTQADSTKIGRASCRERV